MLRKKILFEYSFHTPMCILKLQYHKWAQSSGSWFMGRHSGKYMKQVPAEDFIIPDKYVNKYLKNAYSFS